MKEEGDNEGDDEEEEGKKDVVVGTKKVIRDKKNFYTLTFLL